MIKLSETSKLGCKSWSLQAIETCPGSIGKDGELVEACKGCYATTGNYRYPNVKAPRIHNREDWRRDDWVNDMVAALQNERFFRWFDSGDMYHVKLAQKISEVIRLTPWVNHWIPTRMGKFQKFRPIIDAINAMPNAIVRQSQDDIKAKSWRIVSKTPISAIIADSSVDTDATVCKAYQHEGKCNGCRACWNKSVPAIAYPAHGKKMAKVISLKLSIVEVK